MNQSIKSCAKLQEPRLTLSSLQIFFHVFKDLVGGEEPERKLLAVGDRSFICELLDDPREVFATDSRLYHVPEIAQHGHERKLPMVCRKKCKVERGGGEAVRTSWN